MGKKLVYLLFLLAAPAFGQTPIHMLTSQSEVRVAGGSDSPGTTDMIAAWEFESGALLDDSHAAHTLTNGSSMGGSDCSSSATNAIVGNAANCNGDNFFMGMTSAQSNDIQFGNESFSVAVWFYPAAHSATTENSLAVYDGTDNWELQHDNDDAGKCRVRISDQTIVTTSVCDVTNIGAAATMNFYTFWYDADNDEVCIEVNDSGSPVCGANSTGMNASVDVAFCIGSEATSTTACNTSGEDNGYWDQLFIFGDVLTSAERTWLYNSGSGRTYADL